MNQQGSAILGLTFRMGEDDRTLFAELTPVEGRHPIDSTHIRHALAEHGLDSLFLDEKALADLIRKYDTASEPFTLGIGERKDAEIAVAISSDKMTANLTIIPPCGGRPADREQVLDALKEAGVVSGLLDAEIDAAIAAGKADAKLIARGKEPVHGTDAEFRSLIPEIKSRSPKVDDRGTVDYRDLGLFITVAAGDPLMERIPATAGIPGENVLGEIAPAKPGKNSPFAPGLQGATVSAENQNLLVAGIAGQPLLVAHGVKVEPTLAVQGIDLSTGNLDFEGTVNIAGDVKSGMKIRVSGDVNIGGMVEAAEIQADGNITVKGGIIGHGEKVQEGGSRHNIAHISCGGSISALFVENAHLEAGNCILIEEVAKQSELTAINQVVVGREGSKKGHIVGGLTRATLLIQALVAGSPTGVRTELEVGVNPLLQSRMDAIGKRLQQLEKEKEELARIIAYARDNPQRIKPDLLQKTERTCEKLQLDIDTSTQEKDALQTQLGLADNAKIAIGQKVFGGVHVRIGSKMRQVDEERSYGTFRLQEDEIFFGS